MGLRDSGAGACLRCDAGHAVVVVEGEEPFGFRQLSAAGVDPFEAGPVCPSDELLGVAEVRGGDRQRTQWRQELDRSRSLEGGCFVDEPLLDQQGQRVERRAGCRARRAG